jgi:hypothetical protein
LNGVTTGESTPRMRCVDFMSVSSGALERLRPGKSAWDLPAGE